MKRATETAARLRSMITCAIIDALGWPKNNESYDRAQAAIDRVPDLCRKILDAVEAGS